jgi:hypothetical protein
MFQFLTRRFKMDQLLVTDDGSDQTVTCTTVPRLLVGGGASVDGKERWGTLYGRCLLGSGYVSQLFGSVAAKSMFTS